MPIELPALDDRKFDDLVAELLARVPAHTPEWTNPRPGDPGRTLIELFAWLGDTLLYRANLIPQRQRLAFLRLLDLPLYPARPATGLVALQVKADRDCVALDIPAGARIDKPLPFTTREDCTALPVVGRAFVKRRLTPAEQSDFDALLPELQAAYQVHDATPVGYVTTEVFGRGSDLATGIDIPAVAVDAALWIALLAPSAGQHGAALDALRPDAQGARTLNVGVALAGDPPQELPDLGAGLTSPDALRLQWAMSTAPGSAASPLLKLEVRADGTAGLTRSGVVRLALPPHETLGAPANDPRLNLSAGVGDAPPRLESDADAARLIAWLRLGVDGAVPLHRLRLAWAGLHAVTVEQRQVLPPRTVGVSDGGSGQVLDLGVAALGSVDAQALVVQVHDAATGRVQHWAAVDELGSAGPLDDVVQIDPEAGTVRFGDGVHGRVPAAGSRIVAGAPRDGDPQNGSLRVGGGTRGNLPAGSLAKLDLHRDRLTRQLVAPKPAVDVWQPLPLAGGADAETLDAGQRRIPAHVRHRDRAITADDYRALAREAPAVDLGRVEVLPRFKPHERLSGVPGVVSVMVWPRQERPDFAAPLPRADRLLMAAVHAHLDARRPLACEMYVIGCEYQPFGLSVAVQIASGHAREQVLLGVRVALRRHLWPLPLGAEGIDGPWPADAAGDGGYPLGRTLTDRELEVVVARVPGVAGVSPVRLFVPHAPPAVGWDELPGAGKAVTRFTLEPWQLPELRALAVAEGTDAPGSPDDGSVAATGGPTIHLPVVPDVC